VDLHHRLGVSVIFVIVLAAGAPARGQTFPAEAGWAPLRCGTHVMIDPYRDQSGATDERDIVGDLGAAAGYSASAGTFLFLRLRLDQDPAPNGKLRPFAWGFEISTDGDPTTYEVLLMVNGSDGEVEIYENTATTRPDDPQDPADQPPVASYPFASHGRSGVADGSGFGGDADYFLDMALPWSALNPLGLTPATPVTIWAGSSSSANALDGPGGDLACHDGGTGAPTLSVTEPPRLVLDREVDSDNDGAPDWYEVQVGTDPNDPQSTPTDPPPDPLAGEVRLEGGGGCAVAGGVPPVSWLLPLLGLLLCGLRGRRR